MGFLDDIFTVGGPGLLGGLPSSWSAQYQNPNSPPDAAEDDGLQSRGHGGGLIGALTRHLTDPRSMAKRQPMQNVTAKALLARGIDPQAVNAAVQPGNGELLKNLIAQAFGPQMMQSPDDGIVYPPNTGNVERAFRPDEDIPAGLRKAGASLEPIPRGPADPAYLRTRTSLVVNPVTTNRNAVKPGLQRGR